MTTETSENPWRDEKLLRRLYEDEGYSQNEIADRLGCSNSTIFEWMDKHGIDSRPAEGNRSYGTLGFEARFWRFVGECGEDECWEWQGSRTNRGYGQFMVDGVPTGTHRIAYRLECEPPGELQVNHHCDNRACVNPGHLYAGTQSENVQDMYDRDRVSWRGGARGEANESSKLTEEDVREIRRRYSEEDVYQQDLADGYGVSQRNISRIVRRKIWRHVE